MPVGVCFALLSRLIGMAGPWVWGDRFAVGLGVRFKTAGLKAKTMTLPQEQGLCPRSTAGGRRFCILAQGTDHSWLRLAFCRTHFCCSTRCCALPLLCHRVLMAHI